MKHAGGEYYTPLAQVHDPPLLGIQPALRAALFMFAGKKA